MLGLLGYVSITIVMLVLGLLSKRLGAATHMPPYYRLLYTGALLVTAGIVARVVNLTSGEDKLMTLHKQEVWLLVYNGLPAIGMTLAMVVAWRYWSWLLAERN